MSSFHSFTLILVYIQFDGKLNKWQKTTSCLPFEYKYCRKSIQNSCYCISTSFSF